MYGDQEIMFYLTGAILLGVGIFMLIEIAIEHIRRRRKK